MGMNQASTLRDWSDRLMNPDGVACIKLAVRKGRTGQWSYVPEVVCRPESGETFTAQACRGLADEFNAKAYEHFATMTTSRGEPQQRADFRLVAFNAQDGQLWESATLTLDHADTVPPVPPSQTETTDIDYSQRLQNATMAYYQQVPATLRNMVGAVDFSLSTLNRLQEEAAKSIAAVEITRMEIEAENAQLQERVALARERHATVRQLAREYRPVAQRLLDVVAMALSRRQRKQASEPDDFIDAEAYESRTYDAKDARRAAALVCSHHDRFAATLANAGVPEAMIRAFIVACETAVATEDVTLLRRMQGNVPREAVDNLLNTFIASGGTSDEANALLVLLTFS